MRLSTCLLCEEPISTTHDDAAFCSEACERYYAATIQKEAPPVSTRFSFGAMLALLAFVLIGLTVFAGGNDLDAQQRTSLETRRAERLAQR